MDEDRLDTIADALEMSSDELRAIGLGLFTDWLTGNRRYPTLSQQNQQWYRQILTAAGKTNPTRDQLRTWLTLPYGTAQYLAGVLYDPRADQTDENKKAIADAAVAAIKSAKRDGKLGPDDVHFFVTGAQGKTLESLLAEVLSENPVQPPTLTRQTGGVVKVVFSRNGGLDPLCKALGENVQQGAAEGTRIRDTAADDPEKK